MGQQIKTISQVTPEQYQEVEELYQACNQFEQIQMKMNWNMLQRRPGNDTDDFLLYENKKLIGYLGLYIFNNEMAEVIAFVHPEHRRKKVFKKLLSQARQELMVREIPKFLFIVTHNAKTGQRVMKHMKAVYHHSESQMRMKVEEIPALTAQPITLTVAQAEDMEKWVQLDMQCFRSSAGFSVDFTRSHTQRIFADPQMLLLQAVQDGKLLGKLNVNIHHNTADIFGFAVDPALQGKGIGTSILSQTIERLKGQVEAFYLEVDGKNANARRLYERCGFRLQSQDDYYVLSVQ